VTELRLDFIIPTCNRRALLSRTLASVAVARQTAGIHVGVIVVDNNSTDDTAGAVQEFARTFRGSVRYLQEPRQGKPYALNSGIAAADCDLVALIDDDEEIHPEWICVAHETFQDTALDFIGGPCVPRWSGSVPEWLPPSCRGVIGWVDGGSETKPFGPEFPGMLMGGNAVIRRSVLERCGPYAIDIARTPKRLLSGEDEDMYYRLLASGARGLYIPGLIIYHHVFPERLTKAYFRRWSFWRAVSLSLQATRRTESAPQWLGIPRWYYRVALRGIWKRGRGLAGLSPAAAFEGELDVITLAGLLYGRHMFKAGGAATGA